MHVTFPYSWNKGTKMTLYGVEFIIMKNEFATEQNELYIEHFLTFDRSFDVMNFSNVSDVFPKTNAIHENGKDLVIYYNCRREKFCQLVLYALENYWPIKEIGINLLLDFPYKELACQFDIIRHFRSNMKEHFLFGLQPMTEEAHNILIRKNFTRKKIRRPKTELSPKFDGIEIFVADDIKTYEKLLFFLNVSGSVKQSEFWFIIMESKKYYDNTISKIKKELTKR